MTKSGETYGTEKMARPITLVFALDRSVDGVKEALFSKRTAILFNGILAGREDIITKLFLSSIKVKKIPNNSQFVELCNNSDIDYVLCLNNNKYNLPSNKTLRLRISVDDKIVVKNCFIGMNKFLEIKLNF